MHERRRAERAFPPCVAFVSHASCPLVLQPYMRREACEICGEKAARRLREGCEKH